MVYLNKKLLFFSAVGLALLAFPTVNSVQALSVENLAQKVAPSPWLALKFPQANTDRGQTSSSGGGGVRQTSGGSCLAQGDLPFQLLVPADYNQTNGFYNLATRETSIYAYVPAQDGVTARLQLEDPITRDKSKKTFIVPKEGGIVRFPLSLPADAIKDDFYNLTLTIICDQNNTEDNLNVGLTVNYSPLDSAISVINSPLEQAELYAEQGLWLDALNALAAIAEAEPAEWQEFLVSGGFEQWMNAPLVDCCQLMTEKVSTDN